MLQLLRYIETIKQLKQCLRDLDEAQNLNDLTYHVRESEAEGWDGPRVVKWSNAVMKAKELLK